MRRAMSRASATPVSDSRAVPASVHHSQCQISAIMTALGAPIITVQPDVADRLKLLDIRIPSRLGVSAIPSARSLIRICIAGVASRPTNCSAKRVRATTT